MRAKKYLFFIETKDKKTIYAVKDKNNIYHTVDIYQNDKIKNDFTIANGQLERALAYGIYTVHMDDKYIKKRKEIIMNKTLVRKFNVKDNSIQPTSI